MEVTNHASAKAIFSLTFVANTSAPAENLPGPLRIVAVFAPARDPALPAGPPTAATPTRPRGLRSENVTEGPWSTRVASPTVVDAATTKGR